MTQDHSLPLAEPAEASHGSYWPLVLAAVLTLALVGVILQLANAVVGTIIAAAGALATVAAMIAWGAERFHAAPGVAEIDRGPRERPHLPALHPGEAALEFPLAAKRDLGWWGLVWFIATEAVFFANLIAAYIYLRVSSQVWPPAGTPPQELALPIVNTVILLGSSLPAIYAERAIRRDDRRGLALGLAVAALMGLIFLAGQAREYMMAGFTPHTNIFGASFFALTGFHGAHVLAGLGLLTTMLVLSLRGRFSAAHHFGVLAATTYWHFVDAVWIFLFSLLYLFR